ncbi:cupin domain-containing protein [Kribbella shirazensis]|uniref:Quercetin dioxygenase-like cupin family protein n=1 Tax=Kribbella shirazensis TaxID=1105143 RepID=A0A7X6A5N2_9ACTN|nr:cupin domain-containing protein [Kribbella shirazensis]NIK61459.1 quercetin dioxygenase-like cupin family protein [Kribbella shirazensis]
MTDVATRAFGERMDLESALPAVIRALPAASSVVTAHKLKAAGCDVLFVAAAAGTELPRHDHDTQNATVIISGGMVLVTDQGERRYGPGEWYQTRPGEMHALRFDADTVQIELRFVQP